MVRMVEVEVEVEVEVARVVQKGTKTQDLSTFVNPRL